MLYFSKFNPDLKANKWQIELRIRGSYFLLKLEATINSFVP